MLLLRRHHPSSPKDRHCRDITKPPSCSGQLVHAWAFVFFANILLAKRPPNSSICIQSTSATCGWCNKQTRLILCLIGMTQPKSGMQNCTFVARMNSRTHVSTVRTGRVEPRMFAKRSHRLRSMFRAHFFAIRFFITYVCPSNSAITFAWVQHNRDFSDAILQCEKNNSSATTLALTEDSSYQRSVMICRIF